MVYAYVGLGSNLGDREGTLRAAVGPAQSARDRGAPRLDAEEHQPIGYTPAIANLEAARTRARARCFDSVAFPSRAPKLQQGGS
jgi:hypothetical protein